MCAGVFYDGESNWFWAMDEAPDGSIIYYAMVQKDMDKDTLLEIYLAYRGTEQVAYKVKEGANS